MTLNVGVIGAGLMGSTHVRTLGTAVSGARVTAVSDAMPEAAERIAGAAVVHPDGFDLIRDPGVDAVIVASPSPTHEAFTLACLEAGKPVLCEKPMAPSAEASLRVVEAEAGLGRRLVQLGFMRRFDPAYADMKARLDRGLIGAPLVIHCAHRNPSVHAFFDSAMIITDTAVHEIDTARWLLDQEIVRASVFTGRPTREAAEGVRDPQLIIFESEGGVLVDVEAFVNARYGYDVRCEVVGEAGTLELAAPPAVSTRGPGGVVTRIPSGYQERFASAYQHELQSWVNASALGEPAGPSAWDGYAAAAVCEAAVESLHAGGPADVRLAERPALYERAVSAPV
jgi:myo-inositol 2-dehydrogenase / D-chiro-inositol 1-dehydrogenase